MVEVGKSIVFKIDKDLWARFKGRIADEDARIGNLVKQWIRGYTDPPEREAPAQADKAVVSRKRPRREDLDPETQKAGGVPGDSGVVSRPEKQVRESLDTASDGEAGKPELASLESAGMDFADVQKFAETLALDIKHMTPEEAAFAVLNAILENHERLRVELSREDFEDYMLKNDGMIRWYGTFKEYGPDNGEEDEPHQAQEGGDGGE